MSESLQTMFLMNDRKIISFNPKDLKNHPLSEELFEDLPQEDYDNLKGDIEERGIQDALHIAKRGKSYIIISGHQRKKIGIELGISVPCIIRNDLKEDWQIEEALIKDNLLRRHLNDYQKVRCGLELEPIEKLKAEKKKVEAGKLYGKEHPKGKEIEANLTHPHKNRSPQTRDIVAKQVGFGSGSQFDKAKKVYKDAPDNIKKEWKEGKISTHSAFQKIKKHDKNKAREKELEEQKDQINNGVIPPDNLFDVIVIDPPWPYGRSYDPDGSRVASPYPEMSIETLENLKIPCGKDCILWLWTTNAFMNDAYYLLDKWGATPKTILTWDKQIIGMGSWLRGITEHCILAVKGHPKVNLTNQTTLISEKRREHSRKPGIFYNMVDNLCTGYKLDYFSREKREGWYQYGIETDKFI